MEHSKALPLLSALVNTNKYSQAGVWLKYAECLQILNDLEGAAMAFSNVLVLAPHHTETRCNVPHTQYPDHSKYGLGMRLGILAKAT